MRAAALCAALVAMLPCAGAALDADPARGALLYESRCGGCHALDANRAGPAHRGLIGRRAGSVADFDYSPALRACGIVWDAAMLDRWLADPQALVPGQRMGYSVRDATDRADIIAYLLRVAAP